jgi:hypothetical protein
MKNKFKKFFAGPIREKSKKFYKQENLESKIQKALV